MGIKKFIEKIHRIKTRNNLVNKFINGKYDLYIMIYQITETSFRDFDCITNKIQEHTQIEECYVNGEYYSAAHKDGYYYSYEPDWLPRRYSIKEVRKIVKQKIDSAKKYEFDDRYLTHNTKKNNINITHIIRKESKNGY